MKESFLPLKPRYPFFLANSPKMKGEFLPVRDKFTGEKLTEVALASPQDIQKAIAASCEAAELFRKQPLFERKAILSSCIVQFEKRKEELARTLCLEVGKTIRDARGEVSRFIETFTLALEEAGRLSGEMTDLSRTSRGVGYQGFWKRVPIGPCSFVSPFNFPLNLTAHKVAPAIAVGCPFILKPASRTPITSLILGEILAETSLPPGSFSILPCPREGADLFTTDDRIKLLSFTGSPEVGWEMKNRAGKKRVILELGGNAACIVDESADLKDAAKRILTGAFYQSGQSCISVQRILVHKNIYESFKSLLLEATNKLKAGDPKEESTDLGPLISENEAIRLETWIKESVQKGATLLCGGKRQGSILEATLLENVPETLPLSCEEAFGPVATLSSFSTFEEAIQKANRSRFGLQAGVFTSNLSQALRAWDDLEVGGVVINEVPSWRSDAMPYGGIKDSGLGREGVRFAMEEMTELRSLVIR
ncbi:MAG: aldehyde dehydrogenase family protein [Pseudomonadota bacterium]